MLIQSKIAQNLDRIWIIRQTIQIAKGWETTFHSAPIVRSADPLDRKPLSACRVKENYRAAPNWLFVTG